MKKLIAIVLSIVMTVSVLPFAAFAGFKDVEDGKWYSDGIEYCVTNGYMAGVLDGTFDRNGALTRAMFVLILARLDGVDLVEYANVKVFDDVETDKWYSAAVAWAAENGLASGIGDNQFGYKNPVTREQMALFLYAYSEYYNQEYADLIEFSSEYMIDVESRTDLSVFTDAARVHDWAKDAMEWAVAIELFSGVGENTLDPRGNCTRAQTAVLMRAFEVNVIYDFCEHNWVEPTCEMPGMCTECLLFYAHETGHDFDAAGYCANCGQGPCEHEWTEPDCRSGGYCTLCGTGNPDGEPIDHEYINGFCRWCFVQDCEHVWVEATCGNQSYCEKCYVLGDVISIIGHSYVDGVCTVCGKAENCEHVWSSTGCEDIPYCTKCNEYNLDVSFGHDFVDNVCTLCGKEEICTHEWLPASCGTSGVCVKCQVEGDAPLEHNFVDGVCTNCSALHDDELSAFDNIVANIQARGKTDENNNKYLIIPMLEKVETIVDSVVFMKPDDPDNLYSSFKIETNGTNISLETKLPRDFDGSVPFDISYMTGDNVIFLITGTLVIYEDLDDVGLIIDEFTGSPMFSSNVVAPTAGLYSVLSLMMMDYIVTHNSGVGLSDLGVNLEFDI